MKCETLLNAEINQQLEMRRGTRPVATVLLYLHKLTKLCIRDLTFDKHLCSIVGMLYP